MIALTRLSGISNLLPYYGCKTDSKNLCFSLCSETRHVVMKFEPVFDECKRTHHFLNSLSKHSKLDQEKISQIEYLEERVFEASDIPERFDLRKVQDFDDEFVS